MKKKLLATLLVLCMILPSFGGLSALALDIIDMGDNATLISDNPYNKIHFYFDNQENATIDDAAELQAATASVKGDYAAALMAADGEGEVNENVYITVQFASDYMETNEYEVFKAALESATTPEMRDTVKTQRNTFSKRYHAAIIEENLPILAGIPYTAVNAIDYSSFVTLTVPAAQLDVNVLAEVAENSNILHLSLTDGFETESSSATDIPADIDKTEWLDVLECIGAKDIYNNRTYTGNGVNIGIYEDWGEFVAENVIEYNRLSIDHPNFDEFRNKIHIRPGDESIEGDESVTHAVEVTSILVSLLPDATFYFANSPHEESGMIEGLSWFIDRLCDVVNTSLGYLFYSESYRYDVDGVFDYQIESHDITLVVSAGNVLFRGVVELLPPARAHNAITVGGIQHTDTEGWIHAEGACYDGSLVKPNVSAPFYIEIPGLSGVSDGTSFSAPLVTACAAFLYEYAHENISSYLPSQIVLPILMSSAQKTDNYASYGYNNELDVTVGAGIVNATNAINALQTIMHFFSASGTNQSVVNSISIPMIGGMHIQVALSWQIPVTPTTLTNNNGSAYMPDYNMYIYDPSGNLVASSLYSNGNVEFIRYTATISGTYRIDVRANENVTQTMKLGMGIFRWED